MLRSSAARIYLAVAAAQTLLFVRAERTSNSFFTIEGEGVRIASDGGVCVDAGASCPVTLTARSGWLVNGRESIVYPSPKGLSSGLILTSKLGEDHSCSPPPTTKEDKHDTTFVLEAAANPANLIKMYALPNTSVVVTASAESSLVEKGKHKVTTTWQEWTCPVCGAHQEGRTEVRYYDVEPDTYEWTVEAVGVTQASSTWTGTMSKGLDQQIEFTVTGKRNSCQECEATATATATADVHELSVERPDYLGLDRTDAGLSNWAVTNATARIDPAPTSATYNWTSCGKCQFVGATNEQKVTYGITNSAIASTKFLAEDLKVAATASNADGLSASATCTTNFTVVAVDVQIGSVGEDKEEKEGAFVSYVADTNGVISVEGTNKMVEVKFTCNPTNLPANEMVTVSHTGQGELYEVLQNGELLKVTSATYPTCEITNRRFKLHGHSPSTNIRDGKIEIRHSSSSAKDMANYSVILVDLDIDSDNDLMIEGEDKCFEDLIEDDASKPGKALYLNELDQDKDGIPDWADGYDSNPVFGNQSAADASGTFAQMRLRALSPSSDAIIKFSCADADSDAQVTRTGSGTKASPYVYQECGKKIRIWTKDGKAAQTEDAAVTISAYIAPVPTVPIPNLKLRFEVTDPDDLSHYEGKAVAGTPNVQGDENPNDNNDPRKRMTWNSGVPSGYDSYQRCLSQLEVVPLLASIAGMRRYVSESRLEITDRHSGDNYCVRATLADPERKPFDTLSGMTAGAPVAKSIINHSETLIAWKRVYIEQDEMYKSGCTVTRAFTPTAGASTSTLEVDSTTDFSIGDSIVAFWTGGSVSNVTVVGKTTNTLTVSGLGVSVPKYGGFRIVGRDDVYTVDRRFLPNAYGSAPDGSDGGAFIEFKLLDSVRNPNARVPKYNQFPNLTELQHYADYWFDNRNQRSKNVIDLVIASLRYSNQGQRIFGSTLAGYSLSMVFKAAAINETQANDTAAHEIGHRFGLRKRNGGGFVHIDMSVSQTAHDSLDNCLMSYDRNRNDSSVEFCTNCLSGGSSPFATDSLRSTEDK